MARKDCSKCGDTTCNCAIIEGPGTNITGVGSGASPYVVEADLVTVDTPTVDLSGNGGSTPLSAVVNPCGLTDGLNEVSSGSLLVKGTAPDCLATLNPGTDGQILTSNGTAASWEDAPVTTFSIAGQDGGSESVTSGDTVTFNGVNGIDVEVVAPDTVTVSFDSCELVNDLTDISGGHVLIAPLADACIATLSEGTPGQVLTQDPSGSAVWADGSAPETVSYCDSVTGDPVGYGVIDSALGVEKYYDLNGTVVALRPVSWEPCCCDGGGGSADYLPMQQAASILGVTHAALGTFVGTPSGTLTFVNTSATRSMEVIIQMGTNFEIDVPNTFWATDRFTTELSVNGGAYATVYNQQILAGGNYAGNTVRVQNSVSIDRLSALTVLPGATLTLNIRATTTVLERTTIVGSVANNTILKAWGHYI